MPTAPGYLGSLGLGAPKIEQGDGLGFSDRERVDLAVALLPRAPTVLPPPSPELPPLGWWVACSPGTVALRTGRQRPTERLRVELPGVAELLARANAPAAAELDGELRELRLDRNGEWELPCRRGEDDDAPRDGAARGVVRGWSPRSRARMARTFAEVEWAPLFAVPNTRPGVVTLTYPGDWVSVVPTAEACKRHVEMLRRRWVRRWGKGSWVGAWKLEFQRRGAPHVHALLPVPADGSFVRWLSAVWFEIVGSDDFRHLRAGTGVDLAEGARCSDPRRLAVYFGKHGSFRAKRYQDVPPVEWDSTGRIWGVWGLRRAVAEVGVTQRQLIEARRLLRGVVRSQRRVVQVVGADGRKSSRRYRLRSLEGGIGGGWVLVNDGPRVCADVARFLASRGGEDVFSPPRGPRPQRSSDGPPLRSSAPRWPARL